MEMNPRVKFLGTVKKWSSSVAYLMESSRDYALYVNDVRAIPFVGDGLKHVQRVALWQLRTKAEKVKVVGLVGELMKEGLYVHGDVACADAISLLAAPYKNNVMLITGDGQFGSRVDPVDGIGAPRYVSVKRSKAAMAFLYNDLDIVETEDNYDGSNQQPVHFLPLIPTVLLNGIAGVGVGYSTDILPRRYGDIVDAAIAALKGRKLKPLVPHYERYDVKIAPTGKPNQWQMSGAIKIIDTSTALITELPPGMDLERFRKTLIEMEDAEKINRFTDRSTDAIQIEVKFKRGLISEMKWTEDDLLAMFKLTTRTTERIVVRDWSGKNIVQYPDAETLVGDFVKWRLGFYTKRFEKLLADSNNELVYWKLLEALFKAGFTAKLGKFADRKAMEADVAAVAKKAKIAAQDHHIDRAVSVATYRWTKDFEAEVKTKISDLDAAIADYNATLKSPDRLKAVYLEELGALKKLKF